MYVKHENHCAATFAMNIDELHLQDLGIESIYFILFLMN